MTVDSYVIHVTSITQTEYNTQRLQFFSILFLSMTTILIGTENGN